MRKFVSSIVIAVTLTVAGCNFLPSVKSPTDAIAVAYSTESGLAQAATDALNQGTIKQSVAKEIYTILSEAHKFTELAAAAVAAKDEPSAAKYIQLATGLLTEVQNYLKKG